MRSIEKTDMRLRGSDLRRLSSNARDPVLKEAKAYLAEALESLRLGGDPVDTLALLRALRGTAYARRANQRQALDGVGRWLEQRLQRDPGISVERLRLELGWLRRMVVARAKDGKSSRHALRDDRPFGRDLDRLRQDRARALRAARARR